MLTDDGRTAESLAHYIIAHLRALDSDELKRSYKFIVIFLRLLQRNICFLIDTNNATRIIRMLMYNHGRILLHTN